MKKQLWICGREPKYFESLEPAELNMIAKFPFSEQELRLLVDYCEQIYDNYPEYKESGMIGDKIQKLIKELK